MVNPDNFRFRRESKTVKESHFESARRIAEGIMRKEPIILLPTEDVKEKIVESFKEGQNDEDIELLSTASFKLSLMDPISRTRIRVPVQSANCEHFQCFDLITFLEANLSKEKNNDKQVWHCPLATCGAEAKQEQLRIDGYFREILKTVGPEPLEVELLPDGSWRTVEQEDFKVVPVGENDEIAQIVPRKKTRVENANEKGSHSGAEPTKNDDFAQIPWSDLGKLLGVKKDDSPLEAIQLLKQRLEQSESEKGKLEKKCRAQRAEIEKYKSDLSAHKNALAIREKEKETISSPTLSDKDYFESIIMNFQHFGPEFLELDLRKVEHNRIQAFLPDFAQSFKLLPNLRELYLGKFKLSDFVEFLPRTLRVLEGGYLDLEMLERLSSKCPNLEEIPVPSITGNEDLSVLNALIAKFPRQGSNLVSIGTLGELEELDLANFAGFDGETLEAIIAGCPRLRKIRFYDTKPLSGSVLSKLAKLPSLEFLHMLGDSHHVFTDEVLKEIAREGRLKRFTAEYGGLLTDSSIIYLINHCKLLVSLDVYCCAQVTERSLEAAVAEVNRRHGQPPRTLPFDYLDERILLIKCNEEHIDRERALQIVAAGSPWLALDFDPTPGDIRFDKKYTY